MNTPRRTFLKQVTALGALMGATPGLADAVVDLQSEGDLFKAGVGVRDITPLEPVPMWGYSDTVRNGETTLDPLHAKAVVFACGAVKVALVVMDLGRVPLAVMQNRIRAVVAKDGIQQVIFQATHTHSAPYMELPGLPHLDHVEQKITEAILAGNDNLQEAHVALDRPTIDIAHNRRLMKDGVCYMLWRNEERRPTAPVDHEAGVLRIDGADGKPMVTLVQYACHPVVFGSDSKHYSADWAGAMCAGVKDATGSECIFMQGGAGDINPYLDKTPLAEGGIEAMRGLGKEAADVVIASYKKMKPAAPAAPQVAYKEVQVDVGLRFDIENPVQREILDAVYGPMVDVYMKPFAKNPVVPLGALVLNKDVAFAFTSGELFVQFQMDLKARSPLPNSFLCGYAQDFHAYFPTVRAAAEGGYGASTVSFVGLGAGDKLVTEATVLIGQLMGEFKPVMEPEEFMLHEMDEYPA